jgi:hypothetical protein
VLYERYVPVREIYHFSQQFLNGFTPQRMQAVRGYFDQVFEGSYAKSIPEQQRALLVQIADTKYTQETGRQANREDPLWKTYRNVEASRKYPDLWHQFRDDISVLEGMSIHPTMTNSNDPDLGSQTLGRQGQDAALNRDLTKPEIFPTGTGLQKQQPVGGGFDNSVNPELVKPQEGFPTNQHVDGVTTVFAAKAGEIPGVDIPFRKVNPKYPANQDVLGEVKALQDRVRENRNYDCSEIAEDLLKAAKGKGQIIQVLPSNERKKLTLYEFGERDNRFTYHQVYTDGQYIYDPRLSSEPVPKGDWEIMIRSLNPGATFDDIKMR